VDAESLEMMRSVGGDELLFELIDLTLEDTPPRLAEMRQASDHGDLEKVGFVAHTLKGWSGQLGAKRMVELCLRLEVLKKGGALENTPGLVRDLEREWEEVRSELLAVRGGA
jgi:HPt (histidine-containing phosphotransfer) domain-containing protein